MELELFRIIAAGGEPMALATVLAVKGSSPRHPGTKMLLGARSGRLGTVGGGQGEAQALEACRRCLEGAPPALLRVEMTGTDVNESPMVCGGTSTLLIEPLLDGAPYRMALERTSRGERVLLVKRLRQDGEAPRVETALYGPDGNALLGGGELPPRGRHALDTGRPLFQEASAAFLEPLFPEEKLLVLGGGHVGRALAERAASLGFRVLVVDDRPGWFASNPFPPGIGTLEADFEEAIRNFPFDAATYAMIVSRGHLQDLACARAVLGRPYRYAGFMGSARKVRFILDELLREGHDPARVEDLWAPIGLDIAAETPEELAISILGEMIAVRRDASILPELMRARASRRA